MFAHACRAIRDDEVLELGRLAERGVHPPDEMPFSIPWTDGIGEPGFLDGLEGPVVERAAALAGLLFWLAFYAARHRYDGDDEPYNWVIPDLLEVGDRVGVGCMVNSCRHCAPCEAGMEQYCENGAVFTYGAADRDGTITQGGYYEYSDGYNLGFRSWLHYLLPMVYSDPALGGMGWHYADLTRFDPSVADAYGGLGGADGG